MCFEASGFLCFVLTCTQFDPIGGSLKQNIWLMKLWLCKTFILGITAHALGNL